MRLCLGQQAERLGGGFNGEATPLIPIEIRVRISAGRPRSAALVSCSSRHASLQRGRAAVWTEGLPAASWREQEQEPVLACTCMGTWAQQLQCTDFNVLTGTRAAGGHPLPGACTVTCRKTCSLGCGGRRSWLAFDLSSASSMKLLVPVPCSCVLKVAMRLTSQS